MKQVYILSRWNTPVASFPTSTEYTILDDLANLRAIESELGKELGKVTVKTLGLIPNEGDTLVLVTYSAEASGSATFESRAFTLNLVNVYEN